MSAAGDCVMVVAEVVGVLALALVDRVVDDETVRNVCGGGCLICMSGGLCAPLVSTSEFISAVEWAACEGQGGGGGFLGTCDGMSGCASVEGFGSCSCVPSECARGALDSVSASIITASAVVSD